MRLYHNPADFFSPCRPAATVGVFDGVHLGHLEIIRQLVASARTRKCEAVVVTFEPHPRIVLAPMGEVKLLQTLDEKLSRFELAGVDAVMIIPFDAAFAKISPEDFIRNILVNSLNVSHVITGYDHFFGQARQGNYDLLARLGTKYNFSVAEFPQVNVGESAVSSSAIRRALLAGDVSKANEMLGYHYILKGKIVKGNRIGRNIGYPTANLKPECEFKLVPGQGVYATLTRVNELIYKGMTNIGFRPTIDAEHLTIETNIFDFEEDIYGKEMELSFVGRIRNEKKFASLGDLQLQLAKDKIAAIEMLQGF